MRLKGRNLSSKYAEIAAKLNIRPKGSDPARTHPSGVAGLWFAQGVLNDKFGASALRSVGGSRWTQADET